MQKSYTYNYYSKMEFNADATDEDIMMIASLAEEKAYKVDNVILSNIYNYTCSFESLKLNKTSFDVFVN
ncbi:MAG: hypothetical protein B6I18_04410 [Bacteroidetes bacterium 4572_112]|nr:MAG: hypothetical protein B6I18_04410 [Bacteroidetes bacterium 4572_112]